VGADQIIFACSDLLGDPVESWLREVPRGRARNVATFGRAVRPLSDEDLQRILLFGNASRLEGTTYPVVDEHADPQTQTRERIAILVSSIQRDARFRRDVLTPTRIGVQSVASRSDLCPP
jgi:hypothetical protein